MIRYSSATSCNPLKHTFFRRLKTVYLESSLAGFVSRYGVFSSAGQRHLMARLMRPTNCPTATHQSLTNTSVLGSHRASDTVQTETGNALRCLISHHDAAASRKHSTYTQTNGYLGAINLSRSSPTHLTNTFLQSVHAIHTRVHVRQSTSVCI